MITRICASLAMSLALASRANAFSPNSIRPLSGLTKTKLNSHAIDSEEDAMFLMMKANACAHSETCSLDDAENYLNEVLHIQSDCASGAINSAQICEDILFPSEVIASLREKIENGQSMSSALNKGPLLLSIATAYVLAGVYSVQHSGADAFTAQEWWWAMRDGYLPNMVSQFIQNGGLASVDPVTVAPFTPQEWVWAIRDGYLGDMISQSAKNGGLIVSVADGSVDEIVAAPFLPEEWSMAIKDGYLSDMISHYMRNGGL